MRYRRQVADLHRKDGDPDARVQSIIHQKYRRQAEDIKEHEFIVHSTSWRYSKPNKIMLTYAAYSDALEFDQGKYKSLPLVRLRMITKQSRKPRSQAEVQNKVVSHAIRHIAFLIQTGDQEDFKSALRPATIKVLEKLWVSLAGKVLESGK